MIFWPGIVGEFMGYLPKTLIITLSSSLFVGLIINPVICALFMTIDGDTNKAQLTKRGKKILYGILALVLFILVISSFVTWTMLIVLGALLWLLNNYILAPTGKWWQAKGLNVFINTYENSLIWALNNRLKTVGIAFFVLLMSFVVLGVFNPGTEFFPEDIPPRDVYVQIETPVGSDVKFTRSVVDKVAERVKNIPQASDINTILAVSGAAISSDPAGGGGNSTHKGTVAINFVDYELREGDIFEAMEYIRNDLSGVIAGANITIEKPQDGPPTGPPINLEISGPEMVELTRISNDVLSILEADSIFAKIDGLETDLPDSRPDKGGS